ncbi:carboxylesterase family protein [Lignipirellula cremea]|uniref:carboxylesterase family protein n=1 Tax=Lignipirellula cremea TaxID=2528010 RepID=UPI0018D27358|nr:PHB depolymerase family esterase [Lignipirellula cremea]
MRFRRFLLTCALCLLAAGPLHGEVRWNASFTENYRSEADGADVAFQVQSPPEVEGVELYPLVVVLNGGPRVSPADKFPFFQVRPSLNKIWGYRTLSTYDAMQVIAFMKQNYPIDPNRVYLVGSSAGGSGAMHLASCFPDEFAAVLPLIAAGNNYPLVNFTNLPVAFHHGDRDWVSSVCNVRVQTQRLQALGCPTLLQEYAGAGHSVPGSHEPLMAWLFAQRRNPAPRSLRHECESPSLGRSYWLQIQEFENPHQRASVEAQIASDVATIRPRNITAFSLALHLLPDVKSIRIGDQQLPARENYRLDAGRWQIADVPQKRSTRPYEAGGAANLYQGEPLLIVYGTGGDHPAQFQAAAQKLAAYGGPIHTPMPRRFAVVADDALTRDQQARCNLILLGTPQENRITAALLPRLPVSLKGQVLAAGDRLPVRLEDQVMGLLHPHPDHPQRLVYVLAPFTDEAGLTLFGENPQTFLPGSDGFDRVSQPDLVVQDLQHRIARQMQFGKDWRWLDLPGSNRPIPSRFADRVPLAHACMALMLGQSHVDFALWWGPADKGMWGVDFNPLLAFDPDSYTLADFRTQHRLCETMLGSVSGAELKEIWNRWGSTQELLSHPQIALETLNDDALYRLHLPMDLYIKLGQRQKNLGDPKPGPAFAAEELIPRIFEQKEPR